MNHAQIFRPAHNFKEVIFIEGEVASSKNSRLLKIKRSRRTGRKRVMNLPSLFAQKYMKSCYTQMLQKRLKWLEATKGACSDLPLEVGFYFYRKTHGKADYSNLVQAIQDCMVYAGYLQDDNMALLEPNFLGFEKRKDSPGVSIYL